ncbi:MAG: sugar phosphate isomerase/epimerase [Bryobacteraceae bacterium]|nr:sugar phosphate isomerase/epimerase [Bryobacteraceae bacterium]
MTPKLPIAAITDEFSPDLEKALDAMAAIGMTGAELRMIGSRNIIDIDDDELDRAVGMVKARGMEVISIASPILKCVLPGAPDVDQRFQQDMFAAKFSFKDQPRLADRAFAIAERSGARIVRVFSFWRTVQPGKCFDGIVTALSELAEKAARRGLIVGLENEHACNIATGAETAALLRALDHPNLMVVWDPGNALVSGETPFPDGYRLIPPKRIVHVHAKDCHMEGHRPVWGPLGTRAVDWRGQVQALLDDGYRGYLSLETHWGGPGGDKFAGSVICGWNLRGLAAA